jgi:hypothetical protein
MKNQLKSIFNFLLFIAIMGVLFLIFSCNSDDDDITIHVDGVDTTQVITLGQMCYNVNEYEHCTAGANAKKVASMQLLVNNSDVSLKVINVLQKTDIEKYNSQVIVNIDFFPGRTTYVHMETGYVSLDSLVAGRIFGHFDTQGSYWEREGIYTLDTTINFHGEFNGIIVE